MATTNYKGVIALLLTAVILYLFIVALIYAIALIQFMILFYQIMMLPL